MLSLVFQAILPTFSIILLGWWCRKKNFPGGVEFWQAAEKLVYFILIPTLFFRTAATANIDLATMWPVPVALALGAVMMTVFLLLTGKLYRTDGPTFSSIYQGSVRFNGYLSLAVIGSLYGQNGLALVAMTFGILVPILNLLCIIILSFYGRRHKPLRMVDILLQIAKHPLLVSSLLGLAYNMSGLGLHFVIDETMRLIGQAALGLGLMAVGASLRMQALKDAPVLAFVTNAYKLLLMPVFVYAIALTLDMTGLALQVTVIMAALPGASASYLLAKQMGGNAELMSAIIVSQTLTSILTLSAAIMLVQQFLG